MRPVPLVAVSCCYCISVHVAGQRQRTVELTQGGTAESACKTGQGKMMLRPNVWRLFALIRSIRLVRCLVRAIARGENWAAVRGVRFPSQTRTLDVAPGQILPHGLDTAFL